MDVVMIAIGDPKRRQSLVRRMAAKTKRNPRTGCLEWMARASCNGGYGAINAGRKLGRLRAHRVAWALAGNDLPAGLHVCHRCDNPKCCAPEHLFLGTQQDNAADMIRKGRNSKPPLHRGENHHATKFDRATAIKIKNDPRPAWRIAKEHGVCDETVYRIRQGRTWQELNDAD